VDLATRASSLHEGRRGIVVMVPEPLMSAERARNSEVTFLEPTSVRASVTRFLIAKTRRGPWAEAHSVGSARCSSGRMRPARTPGSS
jgi:hypothetical protein